MIFIICERAIHSEQDIIALDSRIIQPIISWNGDKVDDIIIVTLIQEIEENLKPIRDYCYARDIRIFHRYNLLKNIDLDEKEPIVVFSQTVDLRNLHLTDLSRVEQVTIYSIESGEPALMFLPSRSFDTTILENINNFLRAVDGKLFDTFARLFATEASHQPLQILMNNSHQKDFDTSNTGFEINDPIIESCCARVGFIGNPSDGFGGKTLSFLLENFRATVTIIPNKDPCDPKISIREPCEFENMFDLLHHSSITGYSGASRLIQATCKVFSRLCLQRSSVANIASRLLSHGFELNFNTNIPRMVGLSGSSAIIVATFRALLKHYKLTLEDLNIPFAELPEIILSIEKDELGISAGLQDRVIQVYGGLVLMNFSDPQLEREERYKRLDPTLLPPLYLAYNIALAGDSGKVHSTVRERWQARDPSLVEGMQLIASLAEKAAEALRARDFDVLASLMEKNFATRRELYGDAVVGAKNIAVAELLKAHHIAAKFTGSGGAFVCLKKENPMQWFSEDEEIHLREKLFVLGFKLERIKIAI